MTNENKFGLLSVVYVELPPESAAAKAEMDKTNLDLKALGFRVGRMAYDWGFETYSDLFVKAKAGQPPVSLKQKFQSGDLVTVFKSVSDGDIHWQGAVDLNRKKYHHGLQKGMASKEWVGMFYRHLPAKLEREGVVKFGALEPFSETGTEGDIWALHEYGKAGYDGLVIIENKDKLTVYSAVRDGDVEWEGPVDFGPQAVKKIGWSEVVRETTHMDTQKWLEMSWQNRPMIVVPR